MHEKRLHFASSFLTLTYDQQHLPVGGTLVKRDLQLFMKRLRKVRPRGLRFFACGEYGETFGRPHYHVLLLNTDFPDQRFYKHSPAGHALYRSEELSSLWTAGNADVGAVTFGSCCYVARYCTKLSKAAVSSGRVPEFQVMSRRPGLGFEWFERFHPEAYRADSAIMDEHEVPLPRYYDLKFECVDSERLEVLKRARRRRALLHAVDNSVDRLRVRERFQELKLARFSREACG